jgi:hypothetical protein
MRPAQERIQSDNWLSRLEDKLKRTEELVRQSQLRRVKHLKLMNRGVDNNLQEGLSFLIAQRNMLIRELDYVQYRRSSGGLK